MGGPEEPRQSLVGPSGCGGRAPKGESGAVSQGLGGSWVCLGGFCARRLPSGSLCPLLPPLPILEKHLCLMPYDELAGLPPGEGSGARRGPTVAPQ